MAVTVTALSDCPRPAGHGDEPEGHRLGVPGPGEALGTAAGLHAEEEAGAGGEREAEAHRGGDGEREEE